MKILIVIAGENWVGLLLKSKQNREWVWLGWNKGRPGGHTHRLAEQTGRGGGEWSKLKAGENSAVGAQLHQQEAGNVAASDTSSVRKGAMPH